MRAPVRSAAVSLAIALTLGPVLGGRSPASADAPHHELTDPVLVAAVESATPGTRMPVEVITHDAARARAAVIGLGGVVTGAVPGELVQASMPPRGLEQLAEHPVVQSVRRPLTANRPVTGAVEFGPTTGQNVAVTNASAWHDAGITGAGVKIGIVDFFDLSLWSTSENGPVPDSAHRFCLDTSGAGYCPSTGAPGEEHGVAVAEVLRDMAPDAELYLATAGTASDLMAAIDWFATNGVRIITRSLGAAYDGRGDGSGPLDAVVDHATSLGITWFNSAGNDAAGGYGRFTDGTDGTGYVDFLPGPGFDPDLRVLPSSVGPGVTASCFGLDGIRWSDWDMPAAQITDYQLEVFLDGSLFETLSSRLDDTKPLLGQDYYLGCTSHAVSIRLRRVGGGEAQSDVIEVGLFTGELARSSVAYSAAKPVVDSASPGLIAVGAIDPAASSSVAYYSSQGPTNDGRVKPDITAPSCVTNSIYEPCFSGTSAASPTAAGAAALLYQRGLAVSGAHLAALVKHLVVDIGPPGRDNASGAGRIALPGPPPASIDSSPTQYVPLQSAKRILDTRPESPTPGAPLGPHPQFTVVDVPIGVAGATAAAVSIVSVSSAAPGYVQALPTLMGTLATSSTLNVSSTSRVQPNFAIVPIGANGSISLYLFAGGDVVVDLLGTFQPAATDEVSAGRLIALDPVRILDTRPESRGPVPPEFSPHMPQAGETVRVTGIPAGAAAAVVNVASDRATRSGFIRTQPTGASGLATSNGNFVAGIASSTLSIVPVGADGTISVFTSQSTHLVVDLMGYITGPGAPADSLGLFVPLTPFRQYDSRVSGGIHPNLGSRVVQMTGSAVPAGASAVSLNLTSDAATGDGYLTVFPAGQLLPTISNLNYPATDPRANASVMRLPVDGALNTFVNRATHVIIDVNGYFTGSM